MASRSLLLLSFGALACTTAPGPELLRVQPGKGYVADEREITLEGLRFYPQIEVDAGSQRVDVDDQWTVWMVPSGARTTGDLLPPQSGQPLPTVERLSDTTLRAVVPASFLSVGSYDVLVEDPSGRRTGLAHAYDVTPTRVDRMVLTRQGEAPSDLQPGEEVQFRLDLLDTSGEPLLGDDLPVRVLVEDLGQGTAQVEAVGELASWAVDPAEGRAVPGGPAMPLARTGRTGVDGTVDLRLRANGPALLRITVQAIQIAAALDDVTSSTLVWTDSGLYGLTLGRPSSADAPVRAGEPFEVEVGLVDLATGAPVVAPASDLRVSFRSADGCADGILERGLAGTPLPELGSADFATTSTVGVDLVASRATRPGTACAVQSVVAELRGPSGDVLTTSDPIELHVAAAAPSRLDVLALGGARRAGATYPVRVEVRDRFANRVPATELTALDASDSAGGRAGWSCDLAGAASRGDLGVDCSARSVVAGSDVALMVVGSAVDVVDPLLGASPVFDVLPSVADHLLVLPQIPADGVRAGRPFEVHVVPEDAYGNRPGLVGATGLSVEQGGRALSCGAPVESATGALVVACVPEVAARDVVGARVQLAGRAIEGESAAAVDVLNGSLAHATITLSATEVVAGDPITATVLGADAYGNAFTSLPAGEPSTLTLRTESDGALLASGSVGRPATALVARPTVAGTHRATVLYDGREVGLSEAFEVVAGQPDDLVGRLAEPWVWVEEPVQLDIDVVDAYGNLTAHDGSVKITSRAGGFRPITVAVESGTATADLTWTAAVVPDRLGFELPASVVTGDLEPVLVVEDCGTAGPSLALTFDGADVGRACVLGDSATATGELSADSGSSTTSVAYFGLAADASWATGTSDVLDVDLYDLGPNPVVGLVANSDGCAVTAEGTVWVGPDDDRAVGPVDLSTRASSARIDSGTPVEFVVDEALACDRDPAALSELFVRTDRGTLTRTSPSGRGLTITLDRFGSARFDLDPMAAAEGGVATVVVEAAGGTALGQAELTLEGDDRAPVVWSMSPEGTVADDVDTIVIQLSEALDTSTVDSTSVEVFEGNVALDLASVGVAGADDRIVIELDEVVSTDSSAFRVVVSSDVTDLAGNALSGDGSGVASDFVGRFGALADTAPAITSCASSVSTFRPDGDNGLGTEADAASLSVLAASAPTAWEWTVRDAGGALVHLHRELATGAVSGWAWSGRDHTGRVVDDARYTVSVAAVDAAGNRSGACDVGLRVANGRGAP